VKKSEKSGSCGKVALILARYYLHVKRHRKIQSRYAPNW
jgi:hypothetical protein